jgi:uncharacterized protein YcnI
MFRSPTRAARRPQPMIRRVVTGAVLAAAVTLLIAAPASAHVTVGSDTAQQGAGDAILTFRVPDEDATASTVKVEISFPKATPLAMVKPAAKPGWTFTTTKVTFNPPIKTDDGTITDGVGTVTYTATPPATGIPVGGFDTFQVLVGPLPDKATSLAFPTVQTYSNGQSANWVQPVTDPANEPDSPIPTLQLVAAGKGEAGESTGAGAATATVTASVTVSPVVAATDTGSTATTPEDSGTRTLAISALIVSVLALIGAVGAAVLAFRRGASSEPDGF